MPYIQMRSPTGMALTCARGVGGTPSTSTDLHSSTSGSERSMLCRSLQQ